MKIYEIATGYTSVPARRGAATEIVVESLTKTLVDRNCDVELIDIQASDRVPTKLPITEVSVPQYFTRTDVQLGLLHKLKRVVYSISLALKLRHILKHSQQSVILHFHNQYNLYFFLKLVSRKIRRKARISYTVHSYIWSGDWKEISSAVQTRYFQEIACVQNADVIFVLNEKTAHHFIHHLNVPSDKIHIMKNGVNTNVYHPLSTQEITSFREQIGLPTQKIILQVGSVCDRKNQLWAISELCDYLLKHPDTVYLYAGGIIDESYQLEIQRFIQEKHLENQVRYLGELCPGEELNRYYNAASVTVFPSKHEAFSLVLLESVAAGTPVLTSDRLLSRLDSGCIVYQDCASFIQRTHQLLTNPLDRTVIHQQAAQQYSWSCIADEHLRIWNTQE